MESDPAGHALEWAVLSVVDPTQVSGLLDALSPRLSMGGWRTLVGHDLSVLIDGDLMVVAPTQRRGLADSVIDLRRRGGPRLAGTETMAAARAMPVQAERGPRVELLLRHPQRADAADGWTAALLDLRRDGTLVVRHRSTFAQPQFDPVQPRTVDLSAMRSLAGRASIVVIQPLTLEGAGLDPNGFVALAPQSAAASSASEWSRSIVEQLARLESARRDPLSPWVGTSGAPRQVLDRASMRSATDEWARGSAVRSLLGVPAMMISWKLASAPQRPLPARTMAGGGPPGGGSEDRTTTAVAGSAILFEIGRGEAAVADQQRALAEQARRHLGGGTPRRAALPGEFPGGGAGQSRSRASMGSVAQTTRLVRTADGDVQVVGSDPALVESLASQLVATGQPSEGLDGPIPLRSAGFMHGGTLADEMAALLGGTAGPLVRLAEGLEAIEWRILQPDTHTIEIEATALLAPARR